MVVAVAQSVAMETVPEEVTALLEVRQLQPQAPSASLLWFESRISLGLQRPRSPGSYQGLQCTLAYPADRRSHAFSTQSLA